MSKVRREQQAERLRMETAMKVDPVQRTVFLTSTDGGPTSPPETIPVRLVKEEGMGFAVLMTPKGLFRVKQADVPTPGRWHESKV